MQKIHKKLTVKQINDNVIFTSTLSKFRTEQTSDNIHKVYKDDDDKDTTISRLLDDSFFDNSPFNFNIIRR